MRIREIFVPYIGPSSNQIYAGINRWDRMKHKAQAMVAMSKLGHIPPIDYPVDIEMTPHIGKGKRVYDTSNYSYTYKLLEDALVHKQVLIDDNLRYVKGMNIRPPVRSGHQGSGMLIRLIEVIE